MGSGTHKIEWAESPLLKESFCMGLILLAFLLVLLFLGLGFAIHFLWIVAVIAFLIWIIGFFVSGAERRWYHW